MGLSAALQIGNSALTASQLALQVAGNNLANAATPGYTRQVAILAPSRSDAGGGLSVGTGVRIHDIRRQVDEALQQRLRASVSEESAAHERVGVLASLEASLNELSDLDLSSELSAFFNAWSELANLTQSKGVVVQQGVKLAGFVRSLREDLSDLRTQIDHQLAATVRTAQDLLPEIATLNQAIVSAELGGSTASALRDQRDELVKRLSEHLDVSTVEQPSGTMDLFVGSTPIMLAGRSRGLELVYESGQTGQVARVVVADDRQALDIESGRIGALLASRDGAVQSTIEQLDLIASQLVLEVNRLHSTGTNAVGLTADTGTRPFIAADRARALNDPLNTTLAALPFAPVNGEFTVDIRDSLTGTVTSTRIDVDLDGLTAAGAPGTDDDTSLDDLVAALDAVDGLSASLTADGRLRLTADEGSTFSFSEDSSGLLAVLGVNAYFTGTDATDIAVADRLVQEPSRLTSGRLGPGGFVENGTALEMAALQDRALDALDGASLRASWAGTVQTVAGEASGAQTALDASTIVRESLDAQRAGISGVSVDEESINLLTYQHQYEAAARLISIVDQMTQTLIALV